MATIKSYTDLPQSMKLAKILPLESADMYYDRYGTPSFIDKYVTHESIKSNKYQELIPCWSLASLLNVLQYPTLFQNGDKEWGCTAWIDTTKPYTISPKDNPMDACYEMILKLHESNLL